MAKVSLKRNSWKITWIIFSEFFFISLTVLGGGIAIMEAMLPLIQTVSGLTACNTAVLVGYKIQWMRGALAALAGNALPSLMIILTVSMGMTFAVLIRVRKRNMENKFGYMPGIGSCAGILFRKWNPAGVLPVGVAATWSRISSLERKPRFRKNSRFGFRPARF